MKNLWREECGTGTPGKHSEAGRDLETKGGCRKAIKERRKETEKREIGRMIRCAFLEPSKYKMCCTGPLDSVELVHLEGQTAVSFPSTGLRMSK